MITHSRLAAAKYAHRVICMHAGVFCQAFPQSVRFARCWPDGWLAAESRACIGEYTHPMSRVGGVRDSVFTRFDACDSAEKSQSRPLAAVTCLAGACINRRCSGEQLCEQRAARLVHVHVMCIDWEPSFRFIHGGLVFAHQGYLLRCTRQNAAALIIISNLHCTPN